MIEAYDGDEPYLFVSYAHADSEVVFREIERMVQLGVHVWYDEGIDAGNDWPDEIGRSLAGAAKFVVFISPRSVASKNVHNEINMALNRDKPFLAIYLEETQLSVGLELRMGDIQALMKHCLDEEDYHRKLLRALPAELRSTENPPSSIPVKRAVVPPRGDFASRMSLRFDAGRGERNVCLTIGPTCHVGRDRESDIILRVLPRSQENDYKSRQISGRHAEIEIADDAVSWKNVDCAGGTTADGRSFAANEQFALSAGMLVRPSHVLPLHIDVFDSGHFDAPADFSALQPLVSSAQVPTIASGRINAVGLRRMDDYHDREQYVIIRRGAMLGRGPTCAIRIDHPSLSNRHARFYALGGGLWVEPMDPASVVVVNGTRLRPHDVAAVTLETEILCSGVALSVTPRFQFELGRIDPQPSYAGRDP